MGADPVTAIANAIAQAGAALMPVIEDHYAQKYEKEHQRRVQDFLAILRLPAVTEADSCRRADRLNEYVYHLLGNAGSPAGGVGGVIGVPMDTILSLISEVSEGIKKDALLAKLEFKK